MRDWGKIRTPKYLGLLNMLKMQNGFEKEFANAFYQLPTYTQIKKLYLLDAHIESWNKSYLVPKSLDPTAILAYKMILPSGS